MTCWISKKETHKQTKRERRTGEREPKRVKGGKEKEKRNGRKEGWIKKRGRGRGKRKREGREEEKIGPREDENQKDLVASNVASYRTKGLGKGAHQDVHVVVVGAKVLDHATTVLAQGANAVGLIHVQVALWHGRRGGGALCACGSHKGRVGWEARKRSQSGGWQNNGRKKTPCTAS